MKIGIDVDNTIIDTLPVLKKYCREYNEKVIKRNLKMNEEGFAVANLYEWTQEEKTDFLIKYIDEVREQAPIKKNAQEIIQKLKQEGNTIYIITARKQIGDRSPYEATQKFLKKNDFQYDELVVQKDKKQFCIDNNIDVLIDDEPQNIESVSKFIPVIVFEAIHNEECNGTNIIKVNTWDEVYNIIKEYQKRKSKLKEAIEQMILEADKVSKEEENYTVLEDLFSEED